MALSITASSVIKGTGARTSKGTAGATITAGVPLCKNPTGGKLEAADANGASAYMKVVIGISLHGASDGQPLEYIIGGNLTINAVMTPGTIYVLSATAGGIDAASALASGHTVDVLGVATSTTNLNLNIFNSGAVV